MTENSPAEDPATDNNGAAALLVVMCRLCTNQIAENPIRIYNYNSCRTADIIHQHYGIKVISPEKSGSDSYYEEFLCQPCWTITDQFHRLYTAVREHEAALLAACANAVEKSDNRLLLGTIVPSASTDEQRDDDDAHVKTEDAMVECKVELQEDDGAVPDSHYDNMMFNDTFRRTTSPTPSQMSSSSSSSSSSSARSSTSDDTSATSSYSDDDAPSSSRKRRSNRKASTTAGRRRRSSKTVPAAKREKKDKMPAANKKKAIAAARGAPKRPMKRHTPDQIAEQNIRIRDYFQMQCDLCETQFSVLREAITHYRREHQLPGYLKCCGKKFFNRTLVLDHIQHHGDPNAFHCARCDRSYISQAALNLHMYSHDAQLAKPYKCAVCAAEFVKYFQLTQHQRQKHVVSTQKSFGCDICGKFFFTKWQMSTHIHSVHIAAHICDTCATTFKSKTQLTMHYRRMHSGETRPKIQCSICANWLSDERSLRKHMERHTQAAVACKLCGKVTPNQYALGSHMRYVHSARLYPCTMCDKSFKRAIGLKEHLAAHTGVDLYTCTYCPRTFKSNSNMFAHRKKAHPVEWGRDRELRNHS